MFVRMRQYLQNGQAPYVELSNSQVLFPQEHSANYQVDSDVARTQIAILKYIATI